MNHFKALRLPTHLATIAVVQLMLTSLSQAAPITVPNGDFSMTGVPAPDFTLTGGAGGGIYTAGTDNLYGNNNGLAGEETSGILASIANNTTYTLTIDISNLTSPDYAAGGKGNMALLADGMAITGATASGLGTSTYTPYTVSFTTVGGANASLVGHDLAVQFGLDAYTSTGNSYPNILFQNVTLDGTSGGTPAVPEPSTWAMMLGGLGTLLAITYRRRAA